MELAWAFIQRAEKEVDAQEHKVNETKKKMQMCDEEIEKSANLEKKMKVDKVATEEEIQSIVSEKEKRQTEINTCKRNLQEKLDAERRAMKSVLELEQRTAKKFHDSFIKADARNMDASTYDNRQIERKVKISQLEEERNSIDTQIQINQNHIDQLKQKIEATRRNKAYEAYDSLRKAQGHVKAKVDEVNPIETHHNNKLIVFGEENLQFEELIRKNSN